MLIYLFVLLEFCMSTGVGEYFSPSSLETLSLLKDFYLMYGQWGTLVPILVSKEKSEIFPGWQTT